MLTGQVRSIQANVMEGDGGNKRKNKKRSARRVMGEGRRERDSTLFEKIKYEKKKVVRS